MAQCARADAYGGDRCPFEARENDDYCSDHCRRRAFAQEHRFAMWMKEVDDCLAERSGLTSSDLPDASYRDWYETGMDVSVAADLVLEEESE